MARRGIAVLSLVLLAALFAVVGVAKRSHESFTPARPPSHSCDARRSFDPRTASKADLAAHIDQITEGALRTSLRPPGPRTPATPLGFQQRGRRVGQGRGNTAAFVDSDGLHLRHRAQFFNYGLDRVELDGLLLASGGGVHPQLEAGDARLDRGLVIERYRPVGTGVEQFLDIASLPPVTGDLTVRCTVTSSARLIPELCEAETLIFGHGGAQSFFVSGAVAIDANGHSQPMETHWLDGVILFVLDQKWIATAALPITIDPLVGTVFDVVTVDGGNAWLSNNLDVCYNTVNNEFLVVTVPWDLAASDSDLEAQRVSVAGTLIGPPIVIDANAASTAIDPAVAHDPGTNRYMVAYTDPVTGVNNVKAFFLNDQGVDIGTGQVTVDDLSAADNQQEADVAFDGTNFMVVWRHDDITNLSDIHGRRFTPAGAPVGASFAIEAGTVSARRPAVAYLGGAASTYYVTWAESPTGTELRTIRGSTVTSAQVVAASQAISTSANNNDWPRVAANVTSQEWLVVWGENDAVDSWGALNIATFTPNTVGDIAFRRVNASGIPQGAAEVALQNGVELDDNPGVAWSSVDNDYVIFWQRGAILNGTDVFGARVDGGADTILENGTTIANGANDEYTPFLAGRPGSTKVLGAFGLFDNLNFLSRFQAAMFATTFVAGAAPSSPANLSQFQSNGTTQLLVGDATNELTVLLRGTVTDPDAGQLAMLEVEVRPVATAFTNTITHVGTAVLSGAVSTATVGGLGFNVQYHWQARVRDENGNTSAFVSFGGNTENPPTNPAAVDFSTAGITQTITNLFSENFDAGLPGTWTVAGTGGAVTWKADALATPVGPGPGGAFFSSPNSLNYNNDVDYATAAANLGTATTPTITIGSGTPTLTFQCNYETEDTTTLWDTRRIQVSTDAFVTTPINLLVAESLTGNQFCAAMGTWHSHTIPLTGIAANFQVRYEFNTADAVGNNFDGWFVDDMLVTNVVNNVDGSPNVPAGLVQQDSLSANIPVGGSVTGDGTTVNFRATLSDPNAADTLRLQVEVKAVAAPFDGTGVLTSPVVANGALATVTTTFLSGAFHWRARTIDNTNVPSGWLGFPQPVPNAENPPTNPAATDFMINTAPSAPSFAGAGGQFRTDTITVIPAGGGTDESAVVFKATLTDPGDTVRLHIEVKPTASPFTGADSTGSPSGFVASGTLASVTVTGLAPGSYKWQAWAEDAGGTLSGISPNFTPFPPGDPDFVVVSNTPPASPTALAQYKLDATTGITIGGTTSETGVVLKGTAIDPESNQWRLQVEVRTVGTALTSPASPVIDNVTFFQSTLTPSGSQASATVTGLANGNFHWAARAVDSGGNASAWVSFGANTENPPTNPAATDFNVTAAVGNTAPASAAALGQFKADGTTAIAGGATTNENTVVFKATLTDADGNSVALQVEVALSAGAFTGTPTATGTFGPSGGVASVTVAGLTNNNWMWRARALDSQGATSAAWVDFGAAAGTDFVVDTALNLPPSVPTAPAQFKLNGTTAIAVGANTDELGVVFSGTVTDTDAIPNSVKLQVEVKPVGQPFVNSASAESALVTSGSTASVTVNGLVNLTNYHWQARTVDANNSPSAWVSFGGNAENPPTNPAATDFGVDTSTNTTPPDPTAMGQFRSNGTTAIAAAGNTNQPTVVFKANVDGGNGDQVKLQIEVVPNAGAFTGTATAETAFLASGAQGTITIAGLAINSYKWRARAADIGGMTSNWTDFPPGDPDFNVVANSAPTITILVGTSPQQFMMDGTTVIPPAGNTFQANLIVQAIATDADGDQVRIKVDIGPSGVGLAGSIDATSGLFASGSTIQLLVPIAAVGTWQWQVQGEDENGLAGAFLEFQAGNGIDLSRLANTTPTAGSPAQKDNAMVSVAVGGSITFRAFLEATVNDADGDPVTLEVEVRPAATAFSNAATHSISGGSSGVLSVPVTGLADGDYHWQFRVSDPNGNFSAWTPFNVALIHFTFISDPGGSRNNVKCSLSAPLEASLAVTSTAGMWLLVLLGLAVLVFFGKERRL